MMKRLHILIIVITFTFLSGCENNNTPEQVLLIAKQAIEDNKSSELNNAIISLKNSIQQHQNNPELRASLGKIYLMLGDLGSAAKELNKAESLGAPAEKWLLSLMQVDYLQNEHDSVSRLWKKYNKDLNPKSRYNANLFYALSILSQKERAEGLIELEKLTTDTNNNNPNQILALNLLKLMSPNIKTNDIAKSIAELKIFANENKKNWLAWLLLSKAQFSFKDFEEAAASYQHLAKLLPKYSVAKIYEAESNIEARNNEAAKGVLQELLKQYPTQPYINFLSAKNSIMMKDYTNTKVAIEKTLASNYSNDTIKLIAGITYYQLAEYENAHSYLTSIAKNLPSDHPARKILIATQIRLGYIDNAYTELSDGTIDNDETVLVAAVAHSLLATNKPQQASQLLNQVNISQAPTPALALEIGKLKYRVNDQESLVGLEEIIKNITNDIAISATDVQQARTMELASLVQKNQLDRAKEMTQDWIAQEPNNIGNYLLLVEITKRMKNTSEIAGLYQQMLKIDPNFITAKLYFAAKSLSENKNTQAIKAYNDILNTEPKNVKAIIGKYHALVGLKKDIEANTFIQESLSKEEDPTLSLALAKSYYQMGNIDQALNVLSNRTYLSNRNNIEKYNILALSYLKQENKPKAIAAYNSILEIAPNNILAFTKKILTMESIGLYKEILIDIENFKSNLPTEDPRINLMHAEYLVNAGKAKESMDILNSYKQTNIAESPIYKGILGKTLFLLEDYTTAKPLLEKEYKRLNSSRTATMLYNTYMLTNEPERAITLVQNHLHKDPDNLLFLNLYAEYLFKTDRNKSINEYIKLLALDKTNGIALNNLAWIYYEKQEYNKAKSYIDKALEYYPNNKSILDTAAKISAATN
ncbi:PEP-CTERM system TPR-repeat protein PrsT [Colwellia sp. 6_MG-2023]|uniref:XrtA/PEP-CTERM system TPR-repeat protein PrsT n=1 Tax=Colwellia sp. 6_MG-2023 TaxID=3062676 RepID=UPI0026E3971A|nr:XrtA/PEP-CTERM system TPR-repeat protein PrsT [Colwellia sp. 6_MG-2023]MDO6487695.1 PEP-CTERM system TPR-repeat protein PrsT [Colwellia sp. 6_MG-2023]